MGPFDTSVSLILGFSLAILFFFGVRFLLGRMRHVHVISRVTPLVTVLLVYFAFLLFGLFYELPLPSKVATYIETFFLFIGIYVIILFIESLLADCLFPLRRRVPPPALLRDIIRWTLGVLVFFVLLRVMLKIDLSPIFFTSAAVTLVVGLALQDLLSNLFSGITLNMERPFRTGDWVMAGSETGEVVETTWRATRIKTLDGDFVVIPNSTISKEQIVNYHAPSRLHASHIKVGVSYEVPPSKVKEVMREAALQTDGVLKEHSPAVWLTDFGDFSITYEMKFWIDNYQLHNQIEGEVRTRIWYAFRRNGISIPFPIRNVYMRSISKEEEETERERSIAQRMAVMRPVEILKPLSEDELWNLASRVTTQHYGKGEVLVKQGEPGDSFFIMKDGEVEVSIANQKGERTVITHLGVGEFFGEGSLLTGEARSATITAIRDTQVIVVSKSSFADTLSANSSICTELSKILERRLRELGERRAALEKTAKTEIKVESSSKILRKIKNFFGL